MARFGFNLLLEWDEDELTHSLIFYMYPLNAAGVQCHKKKMQWATWTDMYMCCYGVKFFCL